MIVRSRFIVPMVGEAIENGAVAIEQIKIAAVGRFEEVKAHYERKPRRKRKSWQKHLR